MIIKFFNDTQKPFNAQQQSNFEALKSRLDTSGKFIERTYQSQQQKESLKRSFLKILDQYISLRESAASGFFKGAEKEKLIEQVKRQVMDL